MGDTRDVKPIKDSDKPRPKAATEDSQRSTPQHVERMTPVPSVVDVGEQIFGSSHVFTLAAPWNLGPGAAQMTATLKDAGAFTIVSAPERLAQSSASMSQREVQDQLDAAVRVRFSPFAEGESPRRDFATDLEIVVQWADGTVRHQTVRIRGRARTLEERPAEPAVSDLSPSTANASSQDASFKVDEVHRNRMETAFFTAQNKAGAVARAQHDAIELVEREAGSYVPPPVKRSIWWDLAEGAITLGTGVVAGMISKRLADALVVGLTGAENSAAANQAAIATVATGLKDGMKSAAKKAMDKVSATVTENDTSEKEIAFFDVQRSALNELVTENAQVVIDRRSALLPVLGSAPDLAIRTMQAIGDALEAHRQPAKGLQKQETGASWLAFRARASLGSEEVGAADHEEVTKLSATRPAHPDAMIGSVKGLLDLDIDIEHGHPYIVSATARGVSQKLAEELVGIDLRQERMPLRFVVGRSEPEPTIITRDEVGRLRVSGNLERLSRFDNDLPIRSEAQAELAARRLVEDVMSRKLNPKAGIITDDQQPKAR